MEARIRSTIATLLANAKQLAPGRVVIALDDVELRELAELHALLEAGAARHVGLKFEALLAGAGEEEQHSSTKRHVWARFTRPQAEALGQLVGYASAGTAEMVGMDDATWAIALRAGDVLATATQGG